MVTTSPPGPRDIIGTSLDDTRGILKSFLDYVVEPSEANHVAASKVVDTRTTPASGRKFWSDALSALIAARAALPVDADDAALSQLDVPLGVDLFRRILRERQLDLLGSDPDTLLLFTQAGQPRARYGSATPQPQSQQQQQAGGVEGAAPAGRPGAQDLGSAIEAQLAAAKAAQATAASAAGAAPARAKGPKGTAAAAGKAGKAAKSRTSRATALDLLDDDDPDGEHEDAPGASGDDDALDGDEGGSSGDEDDFASLGASTLAAQLLAAGAQAHSVFMPPAARKTHELAIAYRTKKVKNRVKILARNESSNMPLECATAIIEGTFVDYGKVYAHEPGRTSVEQLASSRDDLFVARPAPGATIPDAHAFLVVYDKVAEVTIRFYPHREREFREYRRWFSGQVLSRPDLFGAYRDYDETYRRNFGGAGYGWTLLDAKDDTSALFRHLQPAAHGSGGVSHSSASRTRARSPSSSGSGDTSRTKRRYDYDYRKDVCARYNQGVAHDASECKAFKPPRRHQEEDRAEEDERTELLLSLSGSEDLDDPHRRLAGTSATPRLRRGLFFPSSAPSAPAVERTELDSPLPSIPSRFRNDPVIAGTIARAPHLFKVSTPLRVDNLRRWLAPHPNRPLVDSVLDGLTNGFWPAYDGPITPSPTQEAPSSLSDDDNDLVALQLAKDFEKGYLSEPFEDLLPGMVVSPIFVVRAGGRKPRAVVDQTGSGLNDGVSKDVARIRYDTVNDLARLMRYRRLRGDDHDGGVVWKSDVSGAFRTLPVAPQWQPYQVHRVRLRDRRGKIKTVYYVDHRVVFGGRFSPRLWCIVLNTILWGVRHRLGLEFPLAYVDDCFGYDTSGQVIRVEHQPSGEQRDVPREQGLLLTAWNLVGVPWEWEKQESGASLVVLGHFVDSLSFTISLPHDAKLKFVDEVEAFMAQHEQPLVRWQRLTGYAQWAATTMPLLKMSLASLYAKTRGKTGRLGPIPLNNENRRDLEHIARELREAPALDILDPALEPWGKDDADAVVYSDACLNAGDGSSGLGFWFKLAHQVHRSTFAARIHPPLTDIFYAEALAVHSAIASAAGSGLVQRRLLVFSDNASTVYAYDSGSARSDVAPLVRDSYELLRRASIDLRVLHIKGDFNTTADKLSRLPIPVLRQWFSTLVEFLPLPFLTPSITPSQEGAAR